MPFATPPRRTTPRFIQAIADKRVAIPVSELDASADGNLTTDLSKESMKNSEEFTEDGFTEESSSSDSSSDY